MAKRNQIINAAYEIFSEKGFHPAKMEEVAERAGVGKGTLYGYFKNKQDLFDQMVIHFLEIYFEEIEKCLESDIPIRQLIKNLICRHIALIENSKASFMRVIMDFSNIPRSREEIIFFHQKFIDDKIDKMVVLFDKAKEKGEIRELDSRVAARFLMGVIKVLSEDLFLNREQVPPEEMAENITDMLFMGMGKRD